MKATINTFDHPKSPVTRAILYRLPNGSVQIRLDMVEKENEIDLTTTSYPDGLVEFDVNIWQKDENLAVVTVTPETDAKKALFINGYFFLKLNKHRANIYIATKPSVYADPEPLPLVKT